MNRITICGDLPEPRELDPVIEWFFLAGMVMLLIVVGLFARTI